MGTLHDHIIGYKIDMDVAGVANRFERIDISAEHIDLPWAPVSPWTQKRVDRRYAADETDSTVLWDIENPMLMAIVGNVTNKWGSPRGYKININGMIKNIVAGNPVGNAMQWGKYNAAVTKRKESGTFLVTGGG
jgi:Cu2+-containing amine oxidase